MINPDGVLSRGSQLAATVKPLHLGAALVEVDTGQPGAPAKAVAVVRSLVARLSAGQP